MVIKSTLSPKRIKHVSNKFDNKNMMKIPSKSLQSESLALKRTEKKYHELKNSLLLMMSTIRQIKIPESNSSTEEKLRRYKKL